MGNAGARELSEEDISDIRNTTHFSVREIREMHAKFLADFPDGVITKENFHIMYTNLFPHGNAGKFAKHVFRAYDADGNGEIDFQEFMATLSIALKGTVVEKLQWAFKLYDLDGNGTVSRSEAIEMIIAVHQLQGVTSTRDKAEEAAVQLFLHLDKNRDNELSEDEFVMGVQTSKAVRKLLQGGGLL